MIQSHNPRGVSEPGEGFRFLTEEEAREIANQRAPFPMDCEHWSPFFGGWVATGTRGEINRDVDFSLNTFRTHKMSIQLVTTCEFIRGIPDNAPELPDGFKLKAKPDQWLMAEGPDGRLWFVGPNRLTLAGRFTREDQERILAEGGRRIVIGELYADGRTRIAVTAFGIASLVADQIPDERIGTITVGPHRDRFKTNSVECPVCGKRDALLISERRGGSQVIICQHPLCRSNGGIWDKLGAKPQKAEIVQAEISADRIEFRNADGRVIATLTDQLARELITGQIQRFTREAGRRGDWRCPSCHWADVGFNVTLSQAVEAHQAHHKANGTTCPEPKIIPY